MNPAYGLAHRNGHPAGATDILVGTEPTRVSRGRRREVTVVVITVDSAPRLSRSCSASPNDDLGDVSLHRFAVGDVEQTDLGGAFAQFRLTERGVEFGVGEGLRVVVTVGQGTGLVIDDDEVALGVAILS